VELTGAGELSPDIASAIEKWLKGTQRDKAEQEYVIFQVIRRDMSEWLSTFPSTCRRRGGVSAVLVTAGANLGAAGANQNSVEIRSLLLNAGPASSPLWPRLDRDLTITTARLILHRARIASTNASIPIAQAVLAELAAHDALPHEKHMPDGTVVRAKTPRLRTLRPVDLGGAAEVADEVEVVAPPEAPTAEEPSAAPVDVTPLLPPDPLPRSSFKERLRQLISEELSARAAALDEPSLKAASQSLEQDIDVAVEQFSTRLRKMKHQGQRRVQRPEMLQACRFLSVPEPARGQLPDMGQARQKKRAMASLYHPDKNGGSQDTRHLFQQTLESFDTIQSFVSQQATTRDK